MPIEIEATLEYGQKLRVGYKVSGSANPYTYLNTFPGPEDIPFVFPVPAPGTYDVEITTICPNCAGNIYSDPEVRTLNSPT